LPSLVCQQHLCSTPSYFPHCYLFRFFFRHPSTFSLGSVLSLLPFDLLSWFSSPFATFRPFPWFSSPLLLFDLFPWFSSLFATLRPFPLVQFSFCYFLTFSLGSILSLLLFDLILESAFFAALQPSPLIQFFLSCPSTFSLGSILSLLLFVLILGSVLFPLLLNFATWFSPFFATIWPSHFSYYLILPLGVERQVQRRGKFGER